MFKNFDVCTTILYFLRHMSGNDILQQLYWLTFPQLTHTRAHAHQRPTEKKSFIQQSKILVSSRILLKLAIESIEFWSHLIYKVQTI